ncbi:MAG: glutathione S-transferase family protein [Pseudomonadota bacterium]
MGLLVDGIWHDKWYDTASTGGKFKRSEAAFRNWITPDGSAGPSGTGGFKAEPGRYHLYVSYACPWAHRTLIFRALKGLENMIDVTVVDWLMRERGWTLDGDTGHTADPVNHASAMSEVYIAAKPDYSGRVTVPLLWDKKTNTVVSNESSEIIRMFNSAFNAVGATGPDYYPHELQGEVDAINERVYHTVNNGVYKSGFATTPEAYEEAFTALFESLDWLEGLLAQRRYLAGDRITEADWRLWTTLIRFDAVYVGHFKCNLRRIADYPNLHGYMLELYQHPGVAATVHMDHIKGHYYASHDTINPTGIVPLGPDLQLDEPHGRHRLKAA